MFLFFFFLIKKQNQSFNVYFERMFFSILNSMEDRRKLFPRPGVLLGNFGDL